MRKNTWVVARVSASVYPVALASSLTSFSLFRSAHDVSGDLKIGGIGDGDEDPDHVLHMVAICNVPRPVWLAGQPRFSCHDLFIDVSPVGRAFFGELQMELVAIQTYDQPAEGMLATVR